MVDKIAGIPSVSGWLMMIRCYDNTIYPLQSDLNPRGPHIQLLQNALFTPFHFGSASHAEYIA